MKINQIDASFYFIEIKPSVVKIDIPILMLHGFPAEPTLSIENEKNIDLAIKIADEKEVCVYLLHYPGLGKNVKTGMFSFIDALESVRLAFNILSMKYNKISILGHSFGAFVASSLLKDNRNKIDKIIFLSPFLIIPPKDELKEMLCYVFKDVQYLLKNKSYEDYLSEFDFIRNKYDFINQEEFLNFNDYFIFQARDDNEVPLEVTMNIAGKLSKNTYIQILDTDHSFNLKREEVFKQIMAIL